MWFTREGIFHGVDEIDGVGGGEGDAEGRAPDAERWRRALSTRRQAWVFRYAREGRKHDMGLGPAIDVSLAEARTKAQEARRLLIEGKDPLIARRASVAASAKRVTFAKAAEDYIEAHGAGWSRKHQVQWRQTLARSVLPEIGEMDVAAVGLPEVLGVLTPIWTATPVTASRVRNRIELILDAAKALGLRTGRTRRGGEATSTNCCQRRRRFRGSSISRRCHIARSAPSWRAYERSIASRLGRLSS